MAAQLARLELAAELLSSVDLFLDDESHVTAVLVVDDGVAYFPFMLLVALSPVMALAAVEDHLYMDKVVVCLPGFSQMSVTSLLKFIRSGELDCSMTLEIAQLCEVLGLPYETIAKRSSASTPVCSSTACETCGKTFVCRAKLIIHKRSHTGEKPFCCDICSAKFRDNSSRIRHSKLHESNDRPFACEICGVSFRQKSNLRAHAKIHFGERPHKCGTCGRSFATAAKLRVHSVTHLSPLERKPLEKIYQCQHCGKTMSGRSNLATHVRIHTGERPYMCNLCSKRFNTSGSRDLHQLSHSSERPYACHICGARLLTLSRLRSHLRIHAVGFACKTCGKRFTKRGDLTKHARTHDNWHPHTCEHCQRTFTHKSNLISHQRIHTGERPYECHICQKRFAQKSNLNTHLKCHGKGNVFHSI